MIEHFKTTKCCTLSKNKMFKKKKLPQSVVGWNGASLCKLFSNKSTNMTYYVSRRNVAELTAIEIWCGRSVVIYYLWSTAIWIKVLKTKYKIIKVWIKTDVGRGGKIFSIDQPMRVKLLHSNIVNECGLVWAMKLQIPGMLLTSCSNYGRSDKHLNLLQSMEGAAATTFPRMRIT